MTRRLLTWIQAHTDRNLFTGAPRPQRAPRAPPPPPEHPTPLTRPTPIP